jgi:hypothetical protein
VGGQTEISVENISTLSVKLAPPEQSFLMAADDLDHLELASTLMEAQAQLIAGLSEKPVLPPKSLSLELKFVASTGGGPQGQFEFRIISGKASRADTQTVKLTFKKPEDP